MFQNSKVIHEIDFNNQKLTLETGFLAQQASSNVVATIGETTVMANVVIGSESQSDYFPLQVVYEEKLYASGKIHGSRFIKREGRPSENAILTGRMVDRSLRSLFDPSIRNEIQVIITILSVDEVNPPDTLAVLAGSTALGLCNFLSEASQNIYAGLVSSVRVGLIKESLAQLWNKKLENLVEQADSFSDLQDILIQVSQTLNIQDQRDKLGIKEIANKLGAKNIQWAKDFNELYKKTHRLNSREIESNFPTDFKLLINPSYIDQEESLVDLVVSGDGHNIMMLEAGAKIVSEEKLGECLDIANSELSKLTNFQHEFLDKAKSLGIVKDFWLTLSIPEEKFSQYWLQFQSDLELTLYYPGTKLERKQKIEELKQKHFRILKALQVLVEIKEFSNTKQINEFLVTNSSDAIHAEFSDVLGEEGFNLMIAQNLVQLVEDSNLSELINIQSELEKGLEIITKKIVQRKILTEEKRVDGRSLDEVRSILIEINPLPRVHGSSLFQRGDTQVLNILTLGTFRDAQLQDDMEDFQENTKRYIHHYNFPKYSVGETGRYGAPGRREIGHGALAEKAILPVIPDDEEFPYTIRLVSECLGSNGSTSMASTCASCLSLMAGGVKLKAPVAGVAMGLVLDQDSGNFKVLTDIQGVEDHLGDMDFKVTGTEDGVTAIQLDNKVSGLTPQILKQALSEAKKGRLFILNEMKKVISESRPQISKNAPKVMVTQVPLDKIGEVIGPNGRTVKGIVQKYEVEVEIDDKTGKTFVFGKDYEKTTKAKELIERVALGYKIGDQVEAEVFRIESYGAFVKIEESGKEGLIHVSNLQEGRTEKVTDILNIGDRVLTEVKEINEKGQINMKLITKLG